jgi:hypothetical protein
MGKVTVLFTDQEEARFAAYCRERGFKKSTLIVRLVREHLDKELPKATSEPEQDQLSSPRSGLSTNKEGGEK